MAALASLSLDAPAAIEAERARAGFKVWLMAAAVGISVAWPLVFSALLFGPRILIRSLSGDSYHYLAIARKANVARIYTYDGVHATNGFHPLWQYAITGLFSVLHLRSHESQALSVMILGLAATTLGVMLAGAAVTRFTNQYALSLLLVPGLYYLAIGVHVRNLSIWAAMDGMESAFSVLFGGLFFYAASHYVGAAAKTAFNPVAACRALGLVLPFLILSRLDDVFIIPAFFIAIMTLQRAAQEKIVAAIWIAAPSAVALFCYLVYNKMTVGAAMPLSGASKAGFVGFLSAFLTAAVHFPPILDLRAHLTGIASTGPVVMPNSFRLAEIFYPFLAAAFGALALWKCRKNRPDLSVWFALCLYILFKTGYNFLNVHPWHQADWYYSFMALSLSVMGAVALKPAWRRVGGNAVAQTGIVTVYVLMTLFAGSQQYAENCYQPRDALSGEFWERHDDIRKQLLARGVGGIINVDDGITAFLLDLPNMHGFAFATDVDALRAYRSGRMLTLAYSRGINAIAGFEYMSAAPAPQSDAEIRQYLRTSPAKDIVDPEIDKFDFSLAYYDQTLGMPFILFKPKPGFAAETQQGAAVKLF